MANWVLWGCVGHPFSIISPSLMDSSPHIVQSDAFFSELVQEVFTVPTFSGPSQLQSGFYIPTPHPVDICVNKSSSQLPLTMSVTSTFLTTSPRVPSL